MAGIDTIALCHIKELEKLELQLSETRAALLRMRHQTAHTDMLLHMKVLYDIVNADNALNVVKSLKKARKDIIRAYHRELAQRDSSFPPRRTHPCQPRFP